MQTLLLASANPGKLAELARLCADYGYALKPQSAFNVDSADEPYATFVENALHKARHAARSTGYPALADDSGLCVPALGGAPGIYSARFAGNAASDDDNNRKLLAALADQPHNRQAFYVCVLVLLRFADDPAPLIASGIWQGTIATTAQGEGGFGYDPLFYLPSLGVTAAQLSADHKNRLSHRAQAARRLSDLLQDNTAVDTA